MCSTPAMSMKPPPRSITPQSREQQQDNKQDVAQSFQRREEKIKANEKQSIRNDESMSPIPPKRAADNISAVRKDPAIDEERQIVASESKVPSPKAPVVSKTSALLDDAGSQRRPKHSSPAVKDIIKTFSIECAEPSEKIDRAKSTSPVSSKPVTKIETNIQSTVSETKSSEVMTEYFANFSGLILSVRTI